MNWWMVATFVVYAMGVVRTFISEGAMELLRTEGPAGRFSPDDDNEELLAERAFKLRPILLRAVVWPVGLASDLFLPNPKDPS